MPWRGTLTSLTSSATSGADVGFLKGVQLPGGPGGVQGVKKPTSWAKMGGGPEPWAPPPPICICTCKHERKSPLLTDDAVAMVFLDIPGVRSPEVMLLTVV